MIDTTQFSSVIEHIEKDLAGLRTGRAMPSLLESLQVETYGSYMSLQQLAAISAPEPRLLVIQPWDQSTMKDIEKAIRQSDMGLNPVVESNLVRVPFPALTEEKRKELVKIMHQKIEEGKIQLRKIRETVLKDLKMKKTEGKMSEDDFFREEKLMQEAVDTVTAQIDAIAAKKEADMMAI